MTVYRLPSFEYERQFWNKGYNLIAGVDEVGRGCFAGPVVAGAVVLSNLGFDIPVYVGDEKIIINDSKKMTAGQRRTANLWIRNNAVSFGIGAGSVAEINRLGVGKATQMAFRRAIQNASKKAGRRVDFLLIDAFYIPFVAGLRRKNQLAIVKGDSKSASIAAASIIAKVYRDKLMRILGKKPKFRKYGWSDNVGYGTKTHREAILKYGTTRYHRRQFVNTYLSGLDLKRR